MLEHHLAHFPMQLISWNIAGPAIFPFLAFPPGNIGKTG